MTEAQKPGSETLRAFARRPDIQGFRALAVALVIFSHLPSWGKFAGGFVGVDVFFVISGFVITRLLISQMQRSSSRSFTANYFAFMWRRILRLVPALLSMIITVLGLALVFGPPLEYKLTARAGLWSELFVSNLFFLKNFDSYWNPELLRNPFLHTWSLGVEFQIYLVMPILLFALMRKTSSVSASVRSAMAWVLVASSVSVLTFMVLVIFQGQISGIDAQGAAFYTPVTRLWEFGAGVIAVLITTRAEPGARTLRILNVVGWTLLALGTLGAHIAGTISPSLLVVVLGAALILYAGEFETGLFAQRVLRSQPFTWVGDRSYSIYLWHWPMLMLAVWLVPNTWFGPPLALAATLALSALSYRYLEQFRKHPVSDSNAKSQVQRIRVPRLVVAIPLALAVTFAFSSAGSSGWLTRPYVSPHVLPEPEVTGSDMLGAIAECETFSQEIHCDFYAPDTPRIVVIGDSLSYRIMPAVALAAKANGFNASELWQGGCSIEFDSCPPFIQNYLQTHDVAGVIVTTNYDRESSLVNAAEAAAGEIPACENIATSLCAIHREAIETFRPAAQEGLDWLLSVTPNVSVATTFPQQSPESWGALYPPLYKRTEAPESGLGQTPLEWQLERQGLYPETIRSVALSRPQVHIWEPNDYLCSDGKCPGVISSGEQIMDDAIHWSWPAARFFYPPVNEFVTDVAARR